MLDVLDALGRLLLAGPDDELAPLRMRIVAAPLARWLDQATMRHLRLGNLPGRAWPPWSWSLIDREVAEVATQLVATEGGPAGDDSSPSS
jgi:hypothetical protein